MQTCSICKHKDRELIDRAIVEGGSVRDIAGHYRVSKSAVDRHRAHITELIKAETVNRAETLESDISTARNRSELLYASAEHILGAALQAGDPKAALQAVKAATAVLAEARNLMELRGAKEPVYQHRDIDAQLEDLLLGRRKVKADTLAELDIPGDVQ